MDLAKRKAGYIINVIDEITTAIQKHAANHTQTILLTDLTKNIKLYLFFTVSMGYYFIIKILV
jgi:hypothetical protein